MYIILYFLSWALVIFDEVNITCLPFHYINQWDDMRNNTTNQYNQDVLLKITNDLEVTAITRELMTRELFKPKPINKL